MEKRVLNILKKYINQDNIVLEKPKTRSFGHFATPVAFNLAKEHKKAPKIIAEELAKLLESEEIFDEVTSLNGFINIKLNEEFLDEYASWVILNQDEFGSELHSSSILLEFVSANPTGPLHIGHARGAVVGNALLKIAKHLGYKITSEYYINDAGNQIELLGLSMFLAGCEHILGLDVTYPQQYYKGEYIIDLAKEAEVEFGKEIFNDEKNIQTLSEFGKDKMLTLIKSNLAEVGVEFDYFISEKSLYDRWDFIREKLTTNSGLYEQEGKIWLKSAEHGDEKDRVIVRENGEPTYLAGDIIYHDDKFSRGYDKYINIWGADHHGYIARVKSAVKFLGYDENKLEIVLSQMVALLKGGEPYKMSKRAGNFILMSDVVEEIGADALKFIFLSKKCDTHLEFDVEDLKRQDSSNPVYYVNYAYARINSIFTKADKKFENVANIKLEGLSEGAKDLLFSALGLSKVLKDAFHSRQVNKLTDYLQALSSEFHSFYNENRVIGSENEEKFLKLFAVVAISLKLGLELLGIKPQEKM